MKFIKYVVIGLIGLILLGVGALAFLGMQSRGGSPLGLVDGTLAACPDSPNCVSSEVGTTDDKSVATLPSAAWEQLPDLIAEMGGTVVDKQDAYIASEFSSGVFGFVDDVEFRRDEAVIHVRSASRVGYSDAGVNAERVAALRAALHQ